MLEQIKKDNQDYIDKYQDKQSSGYHHLKLKDLRKLVADTYIMDENTVVLVERVEDKYFENNNWTTYKGLNPMDYDGHLCLKEELLQDNWQEEYSKLDEETRNSIINQSEADFYTEEFYSPWCITADKEDNVIKIHSHY